MANVYTVGVDFGTLSARAVCLEPATGRVLSSAAAPYPHGVLDTALPDGTPLPSGFALQHPDDWVRVLNEIVPQAVAGSGRNGKDCIGLGIDFTSCTVLPIDKAGRPLCLLQEFASETQAWPKLWKHHGAIAEAEELTKLAEQNALPFLSRCGGRIGAEHFWPKLLETLRRAPNVYNAAAAFPEAGDYIAYLLTGTLCTNACMAGYKLFWDPESGLPSRTFLAAAHPLLADFAENKYPGRILSPGETVGRLSAAAAKTLGLPAGIPVAAPVIDAHAAMPALGITQPGDVLAILGTSGCYLCLSDEEKRVPGLCGLARGGIYPGRWALEAGQSAFGDVLDWFVRHAVPAETAAAAKENGMDAHGFLSAEAARLRPGESGLLALDWWNGNRSVLADANLTGLMLGMTLRTGPAEIYRALLESICFGAKMIFDTFRASNVPVRKLCACGGISEKNPVLMQLLADITGLRTEVFVGGQACAAGAALYAASAAGKEAGGFASPLEAAAACAPRADRVYVPNEAVRNAYAPLYAEYCRLTELFGRESSSVMKRLSAIQRESETHA